MDKIYIIKYCGGSYDDYYNTIVFATKNKKLAIKYVNKFNKILKKWKEYYSRYEIIECGTITTISDEYLRYYDRWSMLKNVNKCYFDEIELR